MDLFCGNIEQQSPGGAPDEDPLPDDGADPHPLPVVGPIFGPPSPPPPPQPEGDIGGWDQWIDPAPQNNAGWGNWNAVQGPVFAEGVDMPIDNQDLPPQEADSVVTGSIPGANVSSDSDKASVHGAEDIEVEQIIVNANQDVGMGEGLLNILQNYQDEEEDTNHADEDNMQDDWMMEDTNLLSPNEAHLQVGMAIIPFVNSSEILSARNSFSKQGLELWDRFFAPHMNPSPDKGKLQCDIPVSWFNFITLMLITPKKFSWARHFLTSPFWDIIKEPIAEENTFTFIILDECVGQMPPHCLNDSPSCMMVPNAPAKKGGVKNLWWTLR